MWTVEDAGRIGALERDTRRSVSVGGKWRERARRIDDVLYGVFAGAVTLGFARVFYGYMRVQTGGEWSAPLDDVFLHFDHARSIARGYPFEWSEGNGFSSGNESLSYPFALAAGYWAGFRGPLLVVWAGIVACISMWAMLLWAKKLFRDLAPWAKYLAPLAVHSVGALTWSLFSGMEVAFYLGVWGAALAAMYAVLDADDPQKQKRRQWLLGTAGVLLVWTRPEGITSIAVLAIGLALALRARGSAAMGPTLLRTGLPSVLALAARAVANKWFTGEASSSGALAKLYVYDPFLTTEEKLQRYREVFEYVVIRNIEHHFADAPAYGWIVPLLAAVPLASRRTRGPASLLWASLVSWLAIVALNEHVRLENERHAMPAIAWLLLAAALGLGLLLTPWFSWARRTWPRLLVWAVMATTGVALVAVFAEHQAPRMREQIWLFGRASRNVRDQQTTTGRLLRRLQPKPRRVLVGNAGAVMYAADLPGLDLRGLGGYGKLPFARAGAHGLGARLELLQRVPPEDRPNYLALHPSDWGSFPSWFGRYLVAIPVHGSVMGGRGAEKVVYRADFRALDAGNEPWSMSPDEKVVDELDVADLLSEREHGYEYCRRPSSRRNSSCSEAACASVACGKTEARLLPAPEHPSRDIFDAGRMIHQHRSERFRLSRAPDAPARLIVRSVGDRPVRIELRVDGEAHGTLAFSTGGWQETSIELPQTRERFWVELESLDADWVNHHVWLVQPK